jgi:transposase
MSVQDVAEMLHLGEQTVRDYRNRFLVQRMASLTYTSHGQRLSFFERLKVKCE